ncbi:tyrosine-type recombinase/integrase [Marinicrinis sediminis]|uniref:Tyrosine-type recombinase/integrase n=1 Tax=Marinicrinis sediminis TaxID=1652465 RepID=A0ABW5RCV7_9BACL
MEQKYGFISRKKNARTLDFDKYIPEFLMTKRLEKRSPKTISTYEQTLKQFKRFFDERSYSEMNADVMRDYIHYLTYEKKRWDDHPTSPIREDGLSARSVNNVIRIMKVFFNYLKNENLISSNPLKSVKYQKQEKDTFEIFTDEDVIKLLEVPNKKLYTGFRDVCMMLVLIDTGLRIKELTNLKASDIDFKMRQITVRSSVSKTNTARNVPISKRTCAELQKLIEMINVESDDYVWLTQFGERYFADTFAKMLKKYGKKAHISGARVSPHTFRHYFAIKFLREGGNPMTLARILGHTSLNMTQVYLKFTGSDLRDQHDIASPVTSLFDKGNIKKSGKIRFK